MSIKSELNLFFKNFEKGKSGRRTGKYFDLENKLILIYGAGNVGQRLQKILIENNLNVVGFLDKNRKLASLPHSIPVFHPEDKAVVKFKDNAHVIIAGLFDEQTRNKISADLSTLEFVHIYHLNEIDFSKYIKNHYYENDLGNTTRRLDILEKEKPKIYEAFDLLHGTKDELCFVEYLKAHLTMDFFQLSPPDDLNMQYLAHDIPHKKDYSNFIDCGGYDGDTVKNILKHDYKINNLIIFEPHDVLFQKIVSFLKAEINHFQSAIAFPCGVYSKTKHLPFDRVDDSASTGRLNKSASHVIQCVKLDDVIHGFKSTFIKMDIEGAELEALKGAKHIIKKDKPQLAICVYHCLSHLWDIPLLLNEIHGNYDFFLRSYNNMTMETVLYAFP